MNNKTTPREFGIDHDNWRPGQWESVDYILNSPYRIIGLNAPTGSGKTAVASAIGHNDGVTAVTFTKQLQQQYMGGYHFQTLYGRGNYECTYHSTVGGLLAEMDIPVMTADGCTFQFPASCPSYNVCPYFVAKNNSIKSNHVVLNYAYYSQILKSSTNVVSSSDRRFVYLDECHNIPALLMSITEMTYNAAQLSKEGLPMWDARVMRVPSQSVRKSKSREWLNACSAALQDQFNRLSSSDPIEAKKASRIQAKQGRFNLIAIDLAQNPDDYYIQVDEQDGIPVLKIHPLTAYGRFNKYLSADTEAYDPQYIFTSATIGNERTFFENILGINDYDWRTVESNFTPEQMPVYIRTDAPKINFKSPESAKQKRAEIMAEMIKLVDGSGIIHTSSFADARDISYRLGRILGNKRVMTSNEKLDTIGKVNEFEEAKKRQPNMIMVSPSMWEGYDGRDDVFSIIAKVPFGMLDESGKARMERNKTAYLWSAATLVEQAAGRVRRGDAEHYEKPGTKNNPNRLVVIVDNNYAKIKSQFSSHFSSCMKRW